MSLVPEIEFSINSHGITIFSDNLNTPRFIPFDQKGRCNACKSDNVEVDYAIHDTGVILYCSRIKKEVFIQFDKYPMIPKHGASIRIKSRSKAFNVPMLGKKKFIGQEVDDLIFQTLAEQPPPPSMIEPPPPPPSLPLKIDVEIVPDFSGPAPPHLPLKLTTKKLFPIPLNQLKMMRNFMLMKMSRLYPPATLSQLILQLTIMLK